MIAREPKRKCPLWNVLVLKSINPTRKENKSEDNELVVKSTIKNTSFLKAVFKVKGVTLQRIKNTLRRYYYEF